MLGAMPKYLQLIKAYTDGKRLLLVTDAIAAKSLGVKQK